MRYLSMTRIFLFWFLSLGVALVSWRFLAMGLDAAFPEMPSHIADSKQSFYLHIIASPIALALGVFQFLPGLRKKRPCFHRWTGRIYGFAILIGGASGLVLALGSFDRPVAAVGFGLLAIVWIGVTGRAIQLAMTRQFAAHRRWMYRSMALTFAAVTLRLILPVLHFGADMDYAEASSYVAWACWVPNLIIIELWLRKSRKASALAEASPTALI